MLQGWIDCLSNFLSDLCLKYSPNRYSKRIDWYISPPLLELLKYNQNNDGIMIDPEGEFYWTKAGVLSIKPTHLTYHLHKSYDCYFASFFADHRICCLDNQIEIPLCPRGNQKKIPNNLPLVCNIIFVCTYCISLLY